MDRDEVRRRLPGVLHLLSPREQVVMSRLYGLGEFEAQDYEAVAAVYGVTGERIRQIEAKAIRKIYQSGPDDSD